MADKYKKLYEQECILRFNIQSQLQQIVNDLNLWKCHCNYWSKKGNICWRCRYDPSSESNACMCEKSED